MRIAVVTTSWPAHEGDPSGHFVQAEARELERAGHEVVVVTPPLGEHGAFGWPGVSARVRARPWLAVDALRWVARAQGDVSGIEVNRVVAHWAVPCAWPIGVASRAAELEVVSHGGDVRLLLAAPPLVRRHVVRAMAARATAWRFVSDALRDRLLASLPPGERRLVEAIAQVRPAHLDVPDVRAAIDLRRRHLGDARVAVSVGRLVASKRVDRAIEHVAVAGNLDALVVVGDGPERGRLERLARARGVNVRFVGRVTRHEALTWIGAARVVLHGSEKEGLSTVLREAESLGIPVRELGGD